MTDDSESDAIERAKLGVIQHLPNVVKRRLSGVYNRYEVRKADAAFAERSRRRLSPAADAPDHVVVVVVDALRADAVAPETTPYLAEMTRTDAVTPAPWTFPAVTSIQTGVYPHEHGAIRQSDEATTGSTDLVVPPKLDEETSTLSDAFADAGYDTYGAFAFHMPFFALGGRFGTHALYDDGDVDRILADFESWLEGRERTFSYLHLGDLHEPVDPPRKFLEHHDVDATIPDLARWDYVDDPAPGMMGKRYREHRKRLYEAAAEYVDDRLMMFAERLDDGVTLVVTGDHGEAFWEHAAFDRERFVDSRPAYCVDHGGTPYESIARVPLCVDGIEFGELDAPASLVDVAPTLLDAAGLTDAFEATGHSLLDGVPAERVPLIESTRYGYERKAAYADGWKLIVSQRDDERVGFALPEESEATLPDDVERRLLAALPAWPDGSEADVAVSGLARDRLEDLGYV